MLVHADLGILLAVEILDVVCFFNSGLKSTMSPMYVSLYVEFWLQFINWNYGSELNCLNYGWYEFKFKLHIFIWQIKI
mgnify:CR=1 FL=1|uniref:Uncharacterized protein n=1 Tax=Aegilops tauschii subsp. strangulata TaxID=200361 RepID=A0A453S3B8_AEGTS